MSKIQDLISPKKEVIFREEKFMLDAGFTLEETPMINKAFGQKNIEIKADGLRDVLKFIAKRLYPTATEDEISKIDVKYTKDLLEVFYQLDDTDKNQKDEVAKVLKK